MKLRWRTSSIGRQYVGESSIGVNIHIVMRRVKVGRAYVDVGFVVYVANETYNTSIMDPELAMKRAEELYGSIIHNEFNRVCK